MFRSLSLTSLITSLRDYLFPKIPLIPLARERDGGIVCFEGGRKHWVLRSDPDAYTVLYQYNITHHNTRGGRYSHTIPPAHYHLAQREILYVRSGVLGYSYNGEVGTAGPGQTVVLEPFHPHSFWPDDSCGEDLLFELTSMPGMGSGLDAEFLDNFDGYLTSAMVARRPPPLLQIMVFAYDAKTVIAFLPPFDRWITAICGRWIGPFVGYKRRYPEFNVKNA
ncbi:hypothetical protein AcV7_007177 [Taiwanofungus camphoratus]|nr:hypothetical protein AcV7_007177 [Antrodia cinnamomea]